MLTVRVCDSASSQMSTQAQSVCAKWAGENDKLFLTAPKRHAVTCNSKTVCLCTRHEYIQIYGCMPQSMHTAGLHTQVSSGSRLLSSAVGSILLCQACLRAIMLKHQLGFANHQQMLTCLDTRPKFSHRACMQNREKVL